MFIVRLLSVVSICRHRLCLLATAIRNRGDVSILQIRTCSNNPVDRMARILNVAEKNDAAKSLSDIMSCGRYAKREGLSVYNKIYEFPYRLLNQNCTMVMTSVSGHLLNFEFMGQYRKWQGCNPVDLFEAPLHKGCPDDYVNIKRTLEREVRNCQTLIIWTDCDREGENIGFEVMQVCLAVKPGLKVLRARFSEITQQAVTRAVNNLVAPDQNTSDAVDVRMELDLRIGAAFTRFQTLRLRRVFPTVLAEQLISYGSCQFPTLGFVVERYKQVQAFVPEPFWKLRVTTLTDDNDKDEVEFLWKRQRLFDYMACLVLYQHCLEKPEATVISVTSKPKSKWRPVALDTVELEKSASRKLRISAKETMRIAEHLYTQGYISYPRTETNAFPRDFDLANLIQMQTQDQSWGAFAANLLVVGPTPRNGNKSDQAHPPIHPTKYTDSLQGNEKSIYEFVVRHFLACCSRDAQGQETTVEIDVNDERFTLSGLMITARNYLDVYPYDKWNAKTIPVFQVGEVFLPNSIEMNQGETSPPSLLTEADLIALMEKHGIGTDATHAEHIETIKSRLYVGVRPDGKFVPGELGMGLVEGYDAMGYEMSKPHLRAQLESDLRMICEGQKNKNVVLAEQIAKYKEVFIEACRQANKIDEALSQFFGNAESVTNEDPIVDVSPVLRPCPNCGHGMVIKKRKDDTGFFVSCMGFPDCRSAIWLPSSVLSASVDSTICDMCQPGPVHKVKFVFKRGSMPPTIPLEHVACIGGCDQFLNEALGISPTSLHSSAASSTQNSSLSSTTRGSNSNHTSNNMSASGNFVVPARPRNNSNPTRRPLVTQNGPQMLAPRPQSAFGNNSRSASDGQSPVCQCGDDARLMTVKKEGPNTGRQFYSCPRQSDSRCGFFLWADSVDDNPTRTNSSGSNQSSFTNQAMSTRPMTGNQPASGHPAAVPQCRCGIDAKFLTVHKEGPNTGRQFYACSKPKSEGCNFFVWADEVDANGGNGRPNAFMSDEPMPHGRGAFGGFGRGSYGGTGRGRGQRHGSTKQPGPSGAPRAKRKCGFCGEEGHTRKTCPHNT